MSPLPEGVTGFGLAAQRHSTSVRSFSTACYQAIRCIGGTVVLVREANEGASCSFHEATLALPLGMQIRVLCNAHFPLLAFAEATHARSDWDFRFVDHPTLAEAFGNPWTVLRADELQQFPDEEVLRLLGSEEVNQLEYWRPQSVGHVVFNHWD